MKRELERLEEQKRLNAAKAKLQVYNANDFYPTQDFVLQNSEAELPKHMQIINQASIADQHPPSLRDVTPRSELQNDMRELVKVIAEAMTANRLPIPEPSIFSGDPLKFNHWKSSFQPQRKSSSFRNMSEKLQEMPSKVIFWLVLKIHTMQHGTCSIKYMANPL